MTGYRTQREHSRFKPLCFNRIVYDPFCPTKHRPFPLFPSGTVWLVEKKKVCRRLIRSPLFFHPQGCSLPLPTSLYNIINRTRRQTVNRLFSFCHFLGCEAASYFPLDDRRNILWAASREHLFLFYPSLLLYPFQSQRSSPLLVCRWISFPLALSTGLDELYREREGGAPGLLRE